MDISEKTQENTDSEFYNSNRMQDDNSNRFHNYLSNYSWIIYGLICLVISYLVIWQRGLYSDDYSVRALVLDPVSGAATPLLSRGGFPMRLLQLIAAPYMAVLISNYEFPIRLFIAFLQGVNSLLLGCLVFRILKSKLAGVISFWLLIPPIFASEIVLWLITVSYLLSAGFSLLAIIFTQKASKIDQGKAKYIALAAILFTLMMFSFEGAMSAVGISVLIGFFTLWQRKHSIFTALKLTFQNTIWSILIVAVTALIFSQLSLVASRGGIDLSPSFLINKIIDFYQRIVWMTFSSGWGKPLLKESFWYGYKALISSPLNITIFFIAVITLIITILTWRDKDHENDLSYSSGVMLMFIGIIGTISSIMFPAVFSKGQIIEYRMLYYPTICLCITVGALCWLISKRFKFNQILNKTIIGIIGVILLLNSIVMLGYCHLFAERYRIDQEQISSITRILPSEQCLPPNATLVLYNFDQSTNFENNDYVSNKLLFGVFETPWSAIDSLKRIYKRNDINVITCNRWDSWKFSYNSQLSINKQLAIQGISTPLDNTLFITYQNGKALLVDELVLNSSDGLAYKISFPVSHKLNIQGVPTTSINIMLAANQLSLLESPSSAPLPRMAPSELRASPDSANPTTQINATWTRNAVDNSFVEIFLDDKYVGNAPGAQTTYQFKGLKPGQTYKIKVWNFWGQGDVSPYSNEVSVSTASE